MKNQLFVQDIEKRDNEVIYWVGEEKKKEFGIIFEQPFTNIHRQGIVESIIFSLGLANDMIENIDNAENKESST